MHSFRKVGFCTNPDPSSKGLLFSGTHKDLKERSELQGEVIDSAHPDFLATAYKRSTTEMKKSITRQLKEMR